MAAFRLLARCQQAVWAYEEWHEGGKLPSLFGTRLGSDDGAR